MPERSLRITEPFDLRGTVRTTDVGRWADGTWWWAAWGPQGSSTIAVRRTGDGVTAEAWGPDADGLLHRLPGLVGVESPTGIRHPGSPAEPYLVRARGLRLGATGDLHEPLVTAILGQVVTTAEAGRSLRSLRHRFGAPAPGPVDGLYAVPTPTVLADLRYEDLHASGIERRRASILIETARRWNRIAPLVDRAPSEARDGLEAIRGIGAWSSAHAVGAAMGAPDEIPVGDFHLPHQVAWALAREDRADDDRMLELLEPYRPHRRFVLVAIVQAGVHAPRYGPRTALRTHL